MALAVQMKENIIDPSLERTDPTPCIYSLFREFNVKFFWNSLNMVAVSWSGRQMTSCAGVCTFRPRSRECHIRLSAPLLSLRPRKDLVETLLHEMIHAYLFITCNNQERSEHGPEFHKHMYRINNAAGTNITVFHTFNEEVKHFQGHVWRCNGQCNKRGPFYGIVRRSTNRAPGPNDRWWDRHRMECTGTFQKIEEPPGYKNKGKKAADRTGVSAPDIRSFFPLTSSPGGPNGQKTNKNELPKLSPNIQTLGRGQPTTKKDEQISILPKVSPNTLTIKGGLPKIRQTNTSFVPKMSSNIHTFKEVLSTPPDLNHFEGSGHVLGSSSKPVMNVTSSTCRDLVRNKWANKYPECPSAPILFSSNRKKLGSASKHSAVETIRHDNPRKKVKVDNADQLTDSLHKNERINHPIHSTEGPRPCPVCNELISSGSLEEHLSICLENSITDDFFDAREENPEIEIVSSMITCPICCSHVMEESVNNHIDECLTLQALKTGLF